jgi:phage terminase small subunit
MGQSARKRHKTPAPPLSARDVRFCQLWVETGNGTRSYIDAGFPHANENVAHSGAVRLLRKDTIRRYIRKIQTEAAEAAGVTVEYLARGFKRAADVDPTRLMGPDGEMLPPSEWPDDVRQCITRFEVEELTERVPDPDRPGRKKKVAVGTRWKVWLENKTECRKVLAQWKRMLAPDKGPKDGEESARDIDVELVARAAAIVAAGVGAVPLGPAVVPEPGAAGAGVPEPRG